MVKSEDPMQSTATAVATKVKKKKVKQTKFRKAPQAPKRFKSAFIMFSTKKHPEIRARLTKEQNSDVPNVAKLVSIEWKKLSDADRAIWLKLAEDDKKRFEMERTIYTGPWKIPASKRAKKDPDAPKRPMSAFLAYSKTMRSTVKGENPELSNTEVSKLLAVRWKEAPEDIRSTFIEQEAEERKHYKIVMAEWRTKNDKMLAVQRKEREDMATLAVEKGIGAIPPEFRPNADAQMGQPPVQSMGHPSAIHAGAVVSNPHGQMYGSSYYDSYNAYRNPEFAHGTIIGDNVLSEPGSESQSANQRMHETSMSLGPSSNAVHLHHDQSQPIAHGEPSHAAHRYNNYYYEEGMGYGQPHEGRQYPSSYSQVAAPAGPWANGNGNGNGNGNDWYPAEAPQYQTGYASQEGAQAYRREAYHTEQQPSENQNGQQNNSRYRAGYYGGGAGSYDYPQSL